MSNGFVKIERTHVRVDLHLHSDASDGQCAAAAIAQMLGTAGVEYAALTDHDTTRALPSFNRAAQEGQITVVTGAELCARFQETEVHLLAYGFNPHDAAVERLTRPAVGVPSDVSEVAETIHRAGGAVFLAHPFEYGFQPETLKPVLTAMVAQGLDGIEAYYRQYTPAQQDQLLALADDLGIPVCGGSDFHGPCQGAVALGVEMPVDRWHHFRAALANGNATQRQTPPPKTPTPQTPTAVPAPKRRPAVPARVKEPSTARVDTHAVLMRAVLPAVVIFLSFVTVLFGILIPRVEELLLDRKRETTVELTNSAWSVLADYARLEQEGRLTRAEAQAAATERVRNLRYGPQGLDYFWITDMHPRMVMHPYRPDLEGTELTDFVDPQGVPLFVEFVRVVRERAAGYVRYVWQWQDDPERLAAKESYVRGFAAWDWVIGTGLYESDVRAQIARMTAYLIDLSLIMTVVVAILLAVVISGTLKSERARGAAEARLQRSHLRYQALVEASGVGTLLAVNDRVVYANKAVLDLLGYDADEISLVKLTEIVSAPEPTSRTPQRSGPAEASVRTKAGNSVAVLVSTTQTELSGRATTIVSIQDLTPHHHSRSEQLRLQLIQQLQTAVAFFTEPVDRVMQPPTECELSSTITAAAALMNRHSAGALVVTDSAGVPVGIVTDHDIRARAVGAGVPSSATVVRIMSAPLVTIDRHAPLFEAFLREREQGVGHLVVTDAERGVVGVVRAADAVRADRYTCAVLEHRIKNATGVTAMQDCRSRIPVLVESLIESGSPVNVVGHTVAAITDAFFERAVREAREALGDPPARYALVALGSHARREQTLASDLDNMLIYESDGAYFRRFSRHLCATLSTSGYRLCPDGAVACDERWTLSAGDWDALFTRWIERPDTDSVAFFRVFFDTRCVAGDEELLSALRQRIEVLIGAQPAFLSSVALETSRHSAPLGVFGRILAGAGGAPPNRFDLKEATVPLVNCARLFALRAGGADCGTLSRLAGAAELGSIPADRARAASQAFVSMLEMRYRQHLAQISADQLADNLIDLEHLTQMERATLKSALTEITTVQKLTALEFHVAG